MYHEELDKINEILPEFCLNTSRCKVVTEINPSHARYKPQATKINFSA